MKSNEKMLNTASTGLYLHNHEYGAAESVNDLASGYHFDQGNKTWVKNSAGGEDGDL